MTDIKKGKKGNMRKRTLIRRVVNFILKSVLAVIFLFVLFLIGINVYLQSNKAKIFSDLPFLNNGTVSFNSANIFVFKDFPSATISLKNVTLHDSLFGQHQMPLLKVGKLSASASLRKLLDNQVEIKSIRLHEGTVALFTDENGYSNLKSLFLKKTDQPNTEKGTGPKILTDDLNISLSDIDFHFTDSIKRTSIYARIDELSADMTLRGKDLSAKINMALDMEELAFKKELGSFVSNSRLEGEVEIELVSDVLSFKPFELSINDERFLFSGNIDLKKRSLSTLILENNSTRYAKVIPLLPEMIQEKLAAYQLADPFYSKTTIFCTLKPGEPPVVYIDFRFEDNEVRVDKFVFEEVNLNGRFVNRIYDDERAKEEGKKNIRIEVAGLQAKHDGFKIRAEEAMITATPETGPILTADINIKGQAAGISKWLVNNQFFFKNGRFDLSANLYGPLNDFQAFVINSDAQLVLNDFTVIYGPADAAFPFDHMSLKKLPGDAQFSIMSSTFKEGLDFRIAGGLQNLPALLVKMSGQRASSDVDFVANKLSWTDFLDLFGKNGYLKSKEPKTDQQKKKSMKETVAGIQFNFQPRLTVAVDTLQYFDKLEMIDFRTGVHFENEHTVVLEKTSFKYGEGTINLSAKLDISDPERTPFEFELEADKLNLAKLLPQFDNFGVKLLDSIENLPENVSIHIKHKGILNDHKGLIPSTSTGEIKFKVDEGQTLSGTINYEPGLIAEGKNPNELKFGGAVKTKIELEGMPSLFNNFFKTDQFFFNKGRFEVQLEYQGNVASKEDLLSKSNATFSMDSSEVYYKLANVIFPLTKVNLELQQDHADFHVYMWFDSLQQKINLDGKIQHLSELLLENTGKHVKTTVDMTAPKVKWKQFVYIFAPKNAPAKEQKQNIDTLKAAVNDLLDTFDPNLHIHFDTFIYSEDIMLRDVKTGIQVLNRDTLILDETGFKFHDGSLGLNGIFNMGIKDSAPFTANFKMEELDIAQLIESLDFLALPILKKLDQFSGKITMNLDLSGTIADDAKGLIMADNNGSFDFEFSNIAIKEFDKIDSIAAKFRMKKRFKELQFAPIINQLDIQGEDIIIPLMEIQSNAVNMFIEGTYSTNGNTNIWVSIPLDNLKSNDRSVIPKKREYAATKKKVYIEIITDEKGKSKTKFHFSKKKFYKQRGILEQYKIDKRKYRAMRKEGKF